jgi:MFS family permease
MVTQNQSAPAQAMAARSGWRAVPRGVWALGFVSMFMDVSSEMIHAILPAFLVSLGASMALIGLIEGLSEAAVAVTKVFSGAISDWLGKRKLLAVIGYALGAASKPIFALAVTPFEVLGARFADRVGKGIRGAPRDALVADITPPEVRGAAYGLRQSLDTVGAFAGPLLAIVLLAWLSDDARTVFWLAVIPGGIAVLLLVLGVEEPRTETAEAPARAGISWSSWRSLASGYWAVVGIGIVFTLARFSEAFLVLRGQEVGLPLALLPVILIVMNLVYALTALPAGSLSDRMGRRSILAASLVVLILADGVLALWNNIAGVLIGVALWGLHMGLSQGLLSALIADTSPQALRGTAFGLFNLLSGATMLAASLIAGFLWEAFGSASTFLAGAGFSVLTLVGLLALGLKPKVA